jgi:hypothetical protein
MEIIPCLYTSDLLALKKPNISFSQKTTENVERRIRRLNLHPDFHKKWLLDCFVHFSLEAYIIMKKLKKLIICIRVFTLFSVCFGCFCFVLVQSEKLKLPVLIFNRNNRIKRLVSDSVKTMWESSTAVSKSDVTLNSISHLRPHIHINTCKQR